MSPWTSQKGFHTEISHPVLGMCHFTLSTFWLVVFQRQYLLNMPWAVVTSRATWSYTVILRKFLQEGGDPVKQEMHGVRCQCARFLVLSVIE